MMDDFTLAFLGGILIGLSATMMLLFNGRITGISGILNGSLKLPFAEKLWRASFLIGLILGGLSLKLLQPQLMENSLDQSHILTAIGGLLVGFGTLTGSGCTSGHGVCGISRLSPRSIVATMNFMAFGIITVYLVNLVFQLRGGH